MPKFILLCRHSLRTVVSYGEKDGVTYIVVTDCSVTGVTIQAYRDIGGIIGFAGGSITDNVGTGCQMVQALMHHLKH